MQKKARVRCRAAASVFVDQGRRLGARKRSEVRPVPTPSAKRPKIGGLPPAPAWPPHGEGEGGRRGKREVKKKEVGVGGGKNHSTQDSHVVPHHGTNWAALRLTAQIGRDAVLSESYGRGCWYTGPQAKYPSPRLPPPAARPRTAPTRGRGRGRAQGSFAQKRPALKRARKKKKERSSSLEEVEQIFRTRA